MLKVQEPVAIRRKWLPGEATDWRRKKGMNPIPKIIIAKIRSTRQAAAAPNSYWEE